MAFINISTNRIDSYILVVCQDRSKGLVGLYVKTTLAVLLIYILNMVWVVLDYGLTSPLLRSELSGIPLKYKSQSDWLKYF